MFHTWCEDREEERLEENETLVAAALTVLELLRQEGWDNVPTVGVERYDAYDRLRRLCEK